MEECAMIGEKGTPYDRGKHIPNKAYYVIPFLRTNFIEFKKNKDIARG